MIKPKQTVMAFLYGYTRLTKITFPPIPINEPLLCNSMGLQGGHTLELQRPFKVRWGVKLIPSILENL